MNTYLVRFDCLVVSDPYYEVIEADTLDECWLMAYEISCERPGFIDGSFDVYEPLSDDDLDEWTSLWPDEED